MRTLTQFEVEQVSGGSVQEDKPTRLANDGTVAIGLAGAIGVASFGAGWGTLGIAAAWALAPVAVVAMAGLAGYAAYSYVSSRNK